MTRPAAATASLCAQMPPLSSSGAQPRPPVQRGRVARAEAEDDIAAFTTRVCELRTRYAKRPSLMERFDKAGLPQPE